MGRGDVNWGEISRKTMMGVNIFFLVVGLIVTILGFVWSDKTNSIKNVASGDSGNVLEQLNVAGMAYIVVLCAIGIIVVAAVGLIGAWKNYRKAIIIYTVFLFLLLCVQLAMGIYLSMTSDSELEAKWREADPNGRKAVQDFLDCCGWNAVDDTTPYPVCEGVSAPVATCHAKALDFISKYIKPLGLFAILLGVVQLIGLVASCGMIVNKKAQKGDGFFD